MTTRKWLGALLGSLMGLTACAATAPVDDNPLAWLETVDPVEQARKQAQDALKQDDLRLLALPRRSLVIPGVDPQLVEDYRRKCGVRLLEGAGDAVRDARQRELLKKARDYATAYNQIILQQCRL